MNSKTFYRLLPKADADPDVERLLAKLEKIGFFVPEEVLLSRVFQRNWKEIGEAVEDLVFGSMLDYDTGAFLGGDAMLLDALDPQLLTLQSQLVETLPPIFARVQDHIGQYESALALQRGADSAAADLIRGIDLDGPSMVNLRSALTASATYYSGAYMDRFVKPALDVVIGQSQGAGSGLFTNKIWKAARDSFRETAQGTSYWKDLANIYASRAYNMSAVAYLDELGFQTYMVSAILDGRTCGRCESLDGCTYQVRSTLSTITSYLATDNWEDAKGVLPFPTTADVADRTTEELSASAEFPLPTYHPRCRCVVVSVPNAL